MPGRILVVDDEGKMRRLLQMALEEAGYEVEVAGDGQVALGIIREKGFDLVITDMRMPRMEGLELLKQIRKLNSGTPIIIMTAYGTVPTAVEAMRAGAQDYVLKPFDMEEMKLLVARNLDFDRLQRQSQFLQEELKARYQFENIVGESKAVRDVFRLMSQVARTKTTVLITGESGTGKEEVARAIHFNGVTEKGPFVVASCAALPETLLESELFGHVRGAFTGAHADRVGRFELASEGTLFLDEISAVSAAVQAKLLRAVEGREFQRVGGTRTISVDVRIIAATNRDLQGEVKAGTFREDLYYRLNVVTIKLPPLRERRGDVPLLVEHFLRRYGEELGRKVERISAAAMENLANYDWPGNVRELENMIERAVVLSKGTTLAVEDFPIEARGPLRKRLSGSKDTYQEAKRKLLADFDREFLGSLLEKSGGNVAEAARRAGMDRKNFHQKLRSLGIKTRKSQD